MNEPEKIASILTDSPTVAVVGCSPNPARPSHRVARFLIERGFEVIPVNPAHREILGRTCYPSLDAIPPEIGVDLVDVFRRSEYVAGLVEPTLRRGAKFFWMQEGVLDAASAERLERAGVAVAMDLCIAKELAKRP